MISHSSNAYSQMMKDFCDCSLHKWNCYDYSNTTKLAAVDDEGDEDDLGSDDAKLGNFRWAKNNFGLMKLWQDSIGQNFAIDDKMSLVQYDVDDDGFDDEDDEIDVDFEDDLMKYRKRCLGQMMNASNVYFFDVLMISFQKRTILKRMKEELLLGLILNLY